MEKLWFAAFAPILRLLTRYPSGTKENVLLLDLVFLSMLKQQGDTDKQVHSVDTQVCENNLRFHSFRHVVKKALFQRFHYLYLLICLEQLIENLKRLAFFPNPLQIILNNDITELLKI